MPTYAEVISSNPSYSAKRYARRLPYVIFAPAIGGLAIILLFFFVPWFSTGEPATLASAVHLKSPSDVSAVALGTSTLSFSEVVTSNDGSASHTVSDSYTLPLIWAIPIVGLIQVALALLLLSTRVLTGIIALAIRLSYLAALVFEVMFFVSAYFLAFGQIKSAGGQIATYPVQGLWFSLLITIVSGAVALVFMPDLRWCWTLAMNDLARAVRISELRASNASAR